MNALSRVRAAVWIGLALWVVAGSLAWLTHAYLGWMNTDLPHTILQSGSRPVSFVVGKPKGQARRVVLLLLDGLRLDVAQEEMPFLKKVAAHGEFARLDASLPSLSRPAYAVLASGATPDRTGVRSNRFLKPLPVDTIMHRVQGEGLKVVGGANLDYMEQNFGDSVSIWHLEYQWDNPELTDKALKEALSEDASLVLLHLVEMDRVGHAQGVGKAYRAQARALDARLEKLLGDFDFGRDALFIMADHGHLDRGGHGGPEPEAVRIPLVVAGRGVVKHSGELRPLGGLARLAPTVSVLLNVPYPRNLSEEPLWEVLDETVLGADYLKARRKEWRKHRTVYERWWLSRVYEDWTSQRWSGETVGNHVSDAADVPDGAELEVLLQARRHTLNEIRRDRRVGRTPLFALLLVPMGMMWLMGALRGYRFKPMLAVPVPALGVGSILWLMGVPLSFSAINNYNDFMGHVWGATGVGLVFYGVFLWLLLRGVPSRRRRDAALFHGTAMVVFYAGIAPFCWLVTGFALKAPMPEPWLMFAPLMAGVVGGSMAALAGLLWLIRGLTPSRPVATEPMVVE